MSSQFNTVLRVEPWGEGQGDFVEIDPHTFNAKFHVPYGLPIDGTDGCFQLFNPSTGEAVEGDTFAVPV